MKSVIAVINPNAGYGKGKIVEAELVKQLSKQSFSVKVFHTTYAGHAIALTREAVAERPDIIVAVGGDGTLHEVGSELVGTGIAMGIIPTGSGNGLASHLGIPKDSMEAVARIATGQIHAIDGITIGGKWSFQTIGLGFDGLVAHRFAAAKKRGFWTYAKIALRLAFRESAFKFSFSIDGVEQKFEGHLLSLCNISEYGGGAKIAPDASCDDGLMEVVMLSKMSWWNKLRGFFCLMTGRIGKFPYYRFVRAKKVVVHGGHFAAQIDGEPVHLNGEITIEVVPSALNVIY